MTGIIHNLAAEKYHADPRCSQSMLKEMNPPARLPVYLSEKREVTAEMIIGSLVHQRVLEPSLPLPRIKLRPADYPANGATKPWNGNATYCKEWLALAKKEGNIVLTQDQWDTVNGCVDAIASDPTCASALANCKSEVSVFGVDRKARLDIVTDGVTILDFKTVPDASRREFERRLIDDRWFVQGAWYLDLFNDYCAPADYKKHFVFVLVEKSPPYDVRRYNLLPETIRCGREQYTKDFETYKACVKSGQWPKSESKIENVGMPKWWKGVQ